MDEYEVGNVYTFSGRRYRYQGGDPEERSSWMELDSQLAELPGDPSIEAARESTSEGAVGALRREDVAEPLDVARLLTHGATLGLSDEIAEVVYGPEVGGQVREDVNTARRRMGGLPAALTEGAPMLAGGLLAGGSAIPAGRGLLAAMGRGAGAGAAEGLVYGMGEARGDVGERARAAIPTAGFGAGIGGLLGGAPAIANAARRGRPGRAGRVAEAFSDAAGNPQQYGRAALDLQDYAESVRRHFYEPLEKAHGAITDPAFLDYIRSPEIRPYTTRVSRRVADGTADPSFREAQRIKDAIRRNIPEALDEFNRLGNKAVPGWRLADKNYGKVRGQIDAMDAGRKHWQSTKAEDVEVITRDMAPEELDAFRVGQAHEILSRLGRRELGQIQPLTDFLDIGPSTEKLLRGIFPTEEGWRAFQRAVNVEKSAEAVRRVLRRFAPWLGVAVAGAFGYRLGRAGGGGGGAGFPTTGQ